MQVCPGAQSSESFGSHVPVDSAFAEHVFPMQEATHSKLVSQACVLLRKQVVPMQV